MNSHYHAATAVACYRILIYLHVCYVHILMNSATALRWYTLARLDYLYYGYVEPLLNHLDLEKMRPT